MSQNPHPNQPGYPDRITLTGLVVFAHHGVFEHERVHGQEFIVDLVVEFDMRAAAISDDVADTVDYGALALTVAAEVRRDPVNLLETVAERVASAILADPRIDAVEVTIHKPQAPIETAFADVSVTIRRTAGNTGNAGDAGIVGDAR
jgi:dihydroneopterin aldolase